MNSNMLRIYLCDKTDCKQEFTAVIKESNKRGVLNRHEVSMVCNAFATNFRITP